jgi:oligoendopeptidase F
MDSANLAQKLGPLPEWNLADLYAAPDDPAFARDMQQGEDDARRFAQDY